MSNGIFSTTGFTDGEKELARDIGTHEAPLAIRLRNHMVESRTSNDAVGPIKLEIRVPETLTDESHIRGWAQNFFEQAFGASSGVAVDNLPTKEGTRIHVELSGAAAASYRAMMHDLDRAQSAMEARVASRG